MSDELALQAYEGLFEKFPNKKLRMEYSGHFKHCGANVTSTAIAITFKLSKEYLELGDELKIGVMQYLLTRLYKSKKTTLEMELYHTFLKKLGDYQTGGGGNIADEELKASFDKINATYFDNYMLAPNIVWGGDSRQRLGHYNFSDDTITMSTSMQGAGEFLDYVMYHELLHKKHKFEHKNGRTRSHTPAFRADERKFVMSNGEEPEKALTRYLHGLGRQTRTKKIIVRKKKKSKNALQRLLDYF